MICSLATRSNRLDVQKLVSGRISLLMNAPRLEKRSSGLMCPSCVSLSLLQPGNSSYEATVKLKAVFAPAALVATLSIARIFRTSVLEHHLLRKVNCQLVVCRLLGTRRRITRSTPDSSALPQPSKVRESLQKSLQWSE
jgi:hypothetical protein